MADQEDQNQQDAAEEAPQSEATGEDAAAEAAAPSDEDAGEGAASSEEQTEGASVVAEQAVVGDDVLESLEEGRNMRKERVGVVVSDKMEKTIVVRIERSKKHPMYQKYMTRSARKMTHDENNEAGEGDTVRIMETRPISKNKRWRLVEILERAA